MKSVRLLMVVGIMLLGMLILNTSELRAQDSKASDQKAKNSDVWNIQSQNVAADLKLDAANAKKLGETYTNFREQVRTELKKLPKTDSEEVHDGKVETINTDARNKFKTEIESFLTKDQAEKTIVLLGSLNSRWDSYLKVLLSLKIEDGKVQEQAQLSLFNYASEYIAARKAADDAGTRFSGKESARLKAELDASLASILTKEQLNTWDTETARKKKNDK